ncbi:MAG: Rieske (2Fe-2S) protein [Candidatus Omnitrophica bacterium]|nr:Rieske (2Fe-2S) protein [Candidatus Omnitrophota bacterium]
MADFVPALALSELPEDGFKGVEVNGRPIVIGRIQQQLFAWLDRCPHAGAPLRIGKRHGEELTCAWHGWTFNLVSGQSIPDNPAFNLSAVPVKIENGQVLVNISL